MKKSMVLLIGLVLLSGCVSSKMRGVQGNHFYSTMPALALNLNSNFEHVKKENQNEWNTFYETMSGTNHRTERHIFSDRLTRRAVIVTITELNRGYWMQPDLSKSQNMIRHGYEKIMGINYQYSVNAAKEDANNNLLLKEYTRVSGGDGDTLTSILYLEVLKDDVKDIGMWAQSARHDPKKIKIVDQFLEDLNKNMQFVDVKTLNLKKN